MNKTKTNFGEAIRRPVCAARKHECGAGVYEPDAVDFDGGGNINLSTNITNLALPRAFSLISH